MSSRESPMNLDEPDDEINAAYFREEVIKCALMERWEHVALLFIKLPKEQGPGLSSTTTPMEDLVCEARKALYLESDGITYNLHVIPEFWQPSDDLYLLLIFLEHGDVIQCDPTYFSKRFHVAARKQRLEAILRNQILRRRILQTIRRLSYETRCRIKSRVIFSEEKETIMRFLIKDVDDADMYRALGAFWGIDSSLVRGHFAFLRSFVDRPSGDLPRADVSLLAVRRDRIIATIYMKTHLSIYNLDAVLRNYIFSQ
ncbi:uncharacterized protein LOC118196753 [Stegodyphus dumicola]|uniref:uncharacterized protein LOC118196753 n=1 Tax=Stegodyphus dumicola TaxID=202533 RepID=UPI0015AC2A4E|nr:uncharacterized protein LOC118196753 [Stegodyphus dumicola]